MRGWLKQNTAYAVFLFLSQPRELNPEPTVYDTVALPVELGRLIILLPHGSRCPGAHCSLASSLRFRNPRFLTFSFTGELANSRLGRKLNLPRPPSLFNPGHRLTKYNKYNITSSARKLKGYFSFHSLYVANKQLRIS